MFQIRLRQTNRNLSSGTSETNRGIADGTPPRHDSISCEDGCDSNALENIGSGNNLNHEDSSEKLHFWLSEYDDDEAK